MVNHEQRRAIILVLDGLGVGEMPDVALTRPQDRGANTLFHIAEAVNGLSLPALSSIGLGEVATVPGTERVTVRGAYGRSMLAYDGADTYMGHQELMGTIPGVPRSQRMTDVRDTVRSALEQAGHIVEPFMSSSSMVLVDGSMVVADNMETDPGRNINVTASYDEVPVFAIVEVGRIVRSVVNVARVIVVMGSGFGVDDIKHHVQMGPEDTEGIDSPGLGVYNEKYQVRHLGIGVDVAGQIPTIVQRSGQGVSLLGKAADVVEGEGAARSRDVRTEDVLRKLLDALDAGHAGLIVANVQEGDLAGHAEDARRWAEVLQQVDAVLPEILGRLRENDLLLITGDHGNDPTIGHSQHTRELTPLLVAGPTVPRVDVGTRSSLADIAATVADFLHVDAPTDGTSFLDALQSPAHDRALGRDGERLLR